MQKTMTDIPMGQIKSFVEDNFDSNFTQKAIDFFENAFLGNKEVLEEITATRDGKPSEIKAWLKREYNVDMDLEGDYAIASILAMLLEFKKKAVFDTFKKEGVEYASGYHKHCVRHICSDKGRNLFEAYELDVTDPDFKIFISKDKIQNEHFDKNKKPKLTFNKKDTVHLTLPLAEFEEKIDLTETFKGSSLIHSNTRQKFDITSAKAVTKLNLGLDKVEIKQAAAICMVVASCSPIDTTPHVFIKDDFYIYVQYKGNLAFSSAILEEDFIQGDALNELKEKETVEKDNEINDTLNPLGLF